MTCRHKNTTVLEIEGLILLTWPSNKMFLKLVLRQIVWKHCCEKRNKIHLYVLYHLVNKSNGKRECFGYQNMYQTFFTWIKRRQERTVCNIDQYSSLITGKGALTQWRDHESISKHMTEIIIEKYWTVMLGWYGIASDEQAHTLHQLDTVPYLGVSS